MGPGAWGSPEPTRRQPQDPSVPTASFSSSAQILAWSAAVSGGDCGGPRVSGRAFRASFSLKTSLESSVICTARRGYGDPGTPQPQLPWGPSMAVPAATPGWPPRPGRGRAGTFPPHPFCLWFQSRLGEEKRGTAGRAASPHAGERACVSMCALTCASVHLCAGACKCVQARALVCTHACTHMHVYACVRVHVCTHLRTCVCACS